MLAEGSHCEREKSSPAARQCTRCPGSSFRAPAERFALGMTRRTREEQAEIWKGCQLVLVSYISTSASSTQVAAATHEV